MTWLGVDIGGANLKAADGRGWARSMPFELWREPTELLSALHRLVESAPICARIAVTMTGELCDCFRTKAEGVRHILTAVEAGNWLGLVYLADGRLVPIDAAREVPELAAASNWHALARFACRYLAASESGLVVDVGSTTTDIVPIAGGYPCPIGFNDTDRLVAGELVYAGVARTPVSAVVDSLPWRGRKCPVAAEMFATTADAYVVLGDLAEQADANRTADGRPLMREFAIERLARMVCADRSTFDADDAMRASKAIRDAHLEKLRAALHPVVSRNTSGIDCAVISGSGEFLARALAREALPAGRIVSMSERIGPVASACAPAYALAVLAAEAHD
jgi:probable H4MPT-linked C1 transfer pathway protein